MRIGDIVVNPWVSTYFNGELNPNYATIYLGDNKGLDYNGRVCKWADKIYKDNPQKNTPWKVIGHILSMGIGYSTKMRCRSIVVIVMRCSDSRMPKKMNAWTSWSMQNTAWLAEREWTVKKMSDCIAEAASWIQKRDKYHEYWQCAKCGGRVVKHDQMTAPPVRCPFCRRRMSDKHQKGE